MTYEMVHNAHDKQNHLPKNRKDLELRTNGYHLSNDSSDEDNDELELRTLNLNKKIIKISCFSKIISCFSF